MKDKLYKFSNNLLHLISNETVQNNLKKINLVFSFFCLLFIFKTLLEVGNQDSINFVFSLNEIIAILVF